MKVYLKVISGEALLSSSEQNNSTLFQHHPGNRVLSVKDMVSQALSMLLARVSRIAPIYPALSGPPNPSNWQQAEASIFLTQAVSQNCSLHVRKLASKSIF